MDAMVDNAEVLEHVKEGFEYNLYIITKLV